MRSIARLTAASALLLAIAACSNQQPPDCSVPLFKLSDQLKAMAENGQGDKARAKAKNYATCYNKEPVYWLMRGALLPSNFGDDSHLDRDIKQAISYTNNAIELDPDNGHNKQAKASFLFASGEYKQAASLYESVLAKVMSSPADDHHLELERQGVFDTVVPYIQGMQHEHRLDHARAKLTPFVADICANHPRYETHYAQTIIWLDQQLNQKSPADVSEACSDFSS